MLKIYLPEIKEGHSTYEVDVPPQKVDLEDNKEFASRINIYYDIEKVGDEIFIKTRLNTTADLLCDRCLDEFQLPLNETVDIILTKDSDLLEREEEDIYLIPPANDEVDITDSVRQSLILAIPFKKLCTQTCKGLCPECGANLNRETCNCTHERLDPRWEALKHITFNNDN